MKTALKFCVLALLFVTGCGGGGGGGGTGIEEPPIVKTGLTGQLVVPTGKSISTIAVYKDGYAFRRGSIYPKVYWVTVNPDMTFQVDLPAAGKYDLGIEYSKLVYPPNGYVLGEMVVDVEYTPPHTDIGIVSL